MRPVSVSPPGAPSQGESIAAAYDPERFRSEGHRVIDALADALVGWQNRQGVVLPWQRPDDAMHRWADLESGPNASSERGRVDLVDSLRQVIASSTALMHPHCMAHQVPPPLPGAALAELVSAVLNNGMAVYEMGPAAVPIELAVVDWMRRQLGFSDPAGGILTSGGSVGNLTALLAMRQVKAGFDAWREGTRRGPPLAVITSADAHYSIARTLGIMGWGEAGAIAAPVDARHHLTARAASEALAEARARGIRVIGIVAAAGSTATGAFDPLDELADLAADEQLWLHVDAAHGGGLALSPTHRDKLRGIARADSVVWDAHKMLMMPALVTAVLFKNAGHAYDAFAQQASYLYARASAESQWWNLGTRTLECTKRMMAIELWCTLRVHGEQVFADIVDRLLELGAAFATKLERASDFELALTPEANIVCYRYRPAGLVPGPELDSLNQSLRSRVAEDGRFYIAGTQLNSGYYLRSAIMNPLISLDDLDQLIDHLRTLCPR
jgi:L-2,4-diaminobutyrate decarboxylase